MVGEKQVKRRLEVYRRNGICNKMCCWCLRKFFLTKVKVTRIGLQKGGRSGLRFRYVGRVNGTCNVCFLLFSLKNLRL